MYVYVRVRTRLLCVCFRYSSILLSEYRTTSIILSFLPRLVLRTLFSTCYRCLYTCRPFHEHIYTCMGWMRGRCAGTGVFISHLHAATATAAAAVTVILTTFHPLSLMHKQFIYDSAGYYINPIQPCRNCFISDLKKRVFVCVRDWLISLFRCRMVHFFLSFSLFFSSLLVNLRLRVVSWMRHHSYQLYIHIRTYTAFVCRSCLTMMMILIIQMIKTTTMTTITTTTMMMIKIMMSVCFSRIYQSINPYTIQYFLFFLLSLFCTDASFVA